MNHLCQNKFLKAGFRFEVNFGEEMLWEYRKLQQNHRFFVENSTFGFSNQWYREGFPFVRVF